MSHVRMLDLHAEYAIFKDEIRVAVDAVLESQRFIGGPAIGELEDSLSKRVGAKHAIAVNTGTDALLCAMMGLEIGQGDEVILPSFTFFATAGSVWRLGAKPVFVDIDPGTFNLDPVAVEKAVTQKTKAIVVVHLFGQCAEMNEICDVAKRHGLYVVEDAAQALGARYHDRSVGSMGDVATLSFYPTKNLGGFGEGGMIFTSNDELADTIRSLRQHGESSRYFHDRVGGNFRLDTMKAAILLVKLKRFDEFVERRRENARQYGELLCGSTVQTPSIADHQHAVFHQYSILTDHRDELATWLRSREVDSGVYYPLGLHLQECFASLGYKLGSLPVTERTCTRILSLPCQPMLTKDEVSYVASCIREFEPGSSDAKMNADSVRVGASKS